MKDPNHQDNEKTETLQTAIMDLEASLAQMKLQSNTFECNVSNQLDTIFKRLDSSSPPVKQEAELKKLKEDNKKLQEENKKLCNRVKHLESLVTSLQTETTSIQGDMSEVKVCHSTLKVKVANIKEALLDQAVAKNNKQPEQNLILDYAVNTSNRFDALQVDDDPEPNPKELIRSITNRAPSAKPRSQNSRPKSKRVILIGDSNAQKLKPSLLSPTADFPKPIWAPTLPDTLTVLEKLSEEQPAPNTVIFHVGTNDVVSKSKDTVINDFDTAISTTQSLFPNADVVISAVPPRRATLQHPNVKDDITAVNLHLRNMCETNNAMTFVSHSQLWKGRDCNEKLFVRDGYHLSDDGVRVLGYNLKKQATGPLGLVPRNQSQQRRNENRDRTSYNKNNHQDSRGRQASYDPITEQGYNKTNHRASRTRPNQRPPTPSGPRQPGTGPSPFISGPRQPDMGPFYPISNDWPSVTEAYGDSLMYRMPPMWTGPPLYPPFNNGWFGAFPGPSGRPRGS